MNNQNQQQISSTQPQILALPGMGDLLKRTFSVYKARLGTFLGIMVFPLICSVFFLILPANLKKNLLLGISLFIIFWLAVMVTSLWSSVSLLYAIKEREEKIGIVESFRKGWHKIISFVWISILAGFITLGGFLLFIIPGIIFAIWFAFPIYVLVSEDLRGMNALFRSKQLVSGKWGSVALRLFTIGVIALVIYSVIFFPLSFFVGKKAADIGDSIISLFLTPFSVTFTFLIYEDLKKFKGEVSFEPPKRGTKIKFILIGIIGMIGIFGILLIRQFYF
ncbi:MAG: hypothetical protein COX89_02185 [Candidatus Nealsonbacteria bacterium CG_4_10_14_0_2_um_filter_37_10]|uniref:Glycerophosphoryl diester phosphodiesterase membrane domain-containing protein n=3 Tax=Candidatus Nealsoniibacteriota TaxID=1817911 RepID=A0A2H0TJU5_9BACT|nr:MAG: hypothetical protein COU43_00330 [Candidatus Nealsonbacteria bacterium CG10_big_fil_rev_8_21_14_0_10_37_25]PIZ89331.1 MAG: hypothetical protein COX89_02185 [Candidatus Nealsonbacteria bacterium CG_4_10_14_0_2_um_filter_37_10]